MPVFTKLHLVQDFCVFKQALFLWRFSIKFEDYSTNYGFLTQIISGDDVVSDAFRWHTKQNEGGYKNLQCKLLLVDPACVINNAQQEKDTFQQLEIYKNDSAQQVLKKGSVIWQF